MFIRLAKYVHGVYKKYVLRVPKEYIDGKWVQEIFISFFVYSFYRSTCLSEKGTVVLKKKKVFFKDKLLFQAVFKKVLVFVFVSYWGCVWLVLRVFLPPCISFFKKLYFII
jgi:hypothetical protein